MGREASEEYSPGDIDLLKRKQDSSVLNIMSALPTALCPTRNWVNTAVFSGVVKLSPLPVILLISGTALPHL